MKEILKNVEMTYLMKSNLYSSKQKNFMSHSRYGRSTETNHKCRNGFDGANSTWAKLRSGFVTKIIVPYPALGKLLLR